MNPIKALRKQKGLNQAELAKEIGATQTAISKWEVGRTRPEAQYAAKLANFFHVSVDYILGIEQDERTTKIDYMQGLYKIIDEVKKGVKSEGAIMELLYQLTSWGLPRVYYDLLAHYRQNDDFKRLVKLWMAMDERGQMELLGYSSSIVAKLPEREVNENEGK